jgi:hypothetical protein
VKKLAQFSIPPGSKFSPVILFNYGRGIAAQPYSWYRKPTRRRFKPPFGLHPLQSGQAWVGEECDGLALIDFSRYMKMGFYNPGWGEGMDEKLKTMQGMD